MKSGKVVGGVAPTPSTLSSDPLSRVTLPTQAPAIKDVTQATRLPSVPSSTK